ncbi:hypothetical protein KSB_61060 [Ktedonobacter robiniae]|uniref:Uncharacterized protein n=1 Tax=Ktedonobacter robiniae TaxID=2778365 RepID=A0ABQ3UY57_9CHLR|nr:hypothetical protein KSB_61060 [Ktedonobacter robiniae]
MSGESSATIATGGETNRRDLLAEPDGGPGPGLDKRRETLCKDFARTERIPAGELPNGQEQLDSPSHTRDITQGSLVVTMD